MTTPDPNVEKDFAPEFLRKVLALAIRSGLHQQVPGALDPGNFSGLVEGRSPSPRARLALLLAQFEQQSPTEWPGNETMDQLVQQERRRLRPEEAQALQDEWEIIRDLEIPDPTFVEQEVREWHLRLLIQRGLLHIADMYQQGRPIDEIRASLQETWRATDPSESSEGEIPREAFPELDARACYGLAGEFIKLVASRSETAPCALLVQFLVMFGNVVGRGPHARAVADQHGANLYAVIVGETAKSRKGSSYGQVKSHFQAVDEVWARKRIVSGMSSGEGLIWPFRSKAQDDADPDPARDDDDLITDLITVDKRLFVYESEFASVLRRSQREGNSLSPILRQAWDFGDLQVLTKNSPVRATGTHISVVAHVTRGELLRYLDRTEMGNGLANRFLFVCARRVNVLPLGGDLHQVNFGPFRQQLRAALDFAWKLGPTRLEFDPGARALWIAEYERLSEGQPGLLGAVTSRAEAQTLRLALVYALLDQSTAIRRPHLEAALALWQYCEASARFIFGQTLGDPTADAILTALRDVFPEGLSRARLSEGIVGHHRAEDIGRALRALLEQGQVRTERKPSGGRSIELWYATGGKRGKGGGRQDSPSPKSPFPPFPPSPPSSDPYFPH